MAADQYDSSFWPVDSWPSRSWPIGYWPLLVVTPPLPELVETLELWHPPSEIVRRYVAAQLPEIELVCSELPDQPDDLAAVYDTSPVFESRVHRDSPRRYYGVQLMLRSREEAEGRARAEQVLAAMIDAEGSQVDIGERSYRIKHVVQATGTFPLGAERNDTRQRKLFSASVIAVIVGLELV